jgi:hypothetical protein
VQGNFPEIAKALTMKTKNPTNAFLELAFDVGHSSIGWAVLGQTGKSEQEVELLGCGAVVFRADDCLASSRRAYRRQRRHIRSTRQRIERMKRLIESLGVMTRAELDKPGCAWPWKLAARVLSSKSGGNEKLLLSWPELWDVLRWYAHNRGYDGNRRWSGGDEEPEDTEKVENANALMEQFGTQSMAETVCAISGIDPLGEKSSCNVNPEARFKGKNAAFPRGIVEGEVRRILQRHFGKLRKVDERLDRALCGQEREDWKAIPCAKIKLPNRYQGGLLFGQLVPRFDNRIIMKCPISGDKVPGRNTREFLDFRWGMQLANVRVGGPTGELRQLKPSELKALDEKARDVGRFTAREFMAAVREVAGCARDNLATMLMHPDAEEALVVDPVQQAVRKGYWEHLFPLLSERMQKRARGRLWHFKAVTLRELRKADEELGSDTSKFDAELARIIEKENTRKKKAETNLTAEDVLNEPRRIKKLDGRAPYSRSLLRKAFDEALRGIHPKKEEGCLFLSEKIRQQQLNLPLHEQTNNHLVRHRLLLLERLLNDMVKEYAGGEKEKVRQVTIEVNRDLREMSGKTAKEIQTDLGRRLANHSNVVAKLEKALEKTKTEITAGLIRKARVADDLGWVCPYTGKPFDPIDLIHKRVDKDHIVPRSLRPTDSLESLVITYNEVNTWKGKRTGLQFIKEFGGKTVPGLPNLAIVTPQRYLEFVQKLEAFKGHDDDKKRKKRRKELMLLENYEEKGFTPKDLTVTSQLVRLGAQVIKRVFAGEKAAPKVISLPGSVTGTVRKGWDVLGCLETANPQVVDENGILRSKTDIRDITHLHHALDACVLAFAAHFIPNDGRIWELIVKRTLAPQEEAELKRLNIFQMNKGGKFQIRDLRDAYKEQIRKRLSERRVVQHIPARMTGLRVEQNVWRVLKQEEEGEVTLVQYRRGPDGKRVENVTTEKTSKLLGLRDGKLKQLKGVLIIPENFGVALDPVPTIIPYHKVPARLAELRVANGGKPVRVIRNGQLIAVATGNFKGIWKVFSAKNNASGMALDIGRADVVRLKNKTEGHKINVLLASLLKGGLTILKAPLTGVASCPTT